MTNMDCAAGNLCENGMCTGRRPNGGMCMTADECESGNCVDGVCCNTACNGQCEACDVMGSLGTCSAVTGAPHGSRTACMGTGTCAATCDGMAREACTFPGASRECRPASCSNGTATAAAACDGMGACPAEMTTACGPYTCGDTACRTSCTQDADCAMGFTCTNGMCTAVVTDAGVADAGNPQDAGTTQDAGMKGQDSGTFLDSGSSATNSLEGGGCGCAVPGSSSSRGRGAAALGLLGLVALLHERRRRGA